MHASPPAAMQPPAEQAAEQPPPRPPRPNAALEDGEVLIDDEDLRITFLAGRTSDGPAIVSFAGVGRGLGGIQSEEFAGTLLADAVEHDTYFVIDKNRSWYNAGTDKLEALMLPRLAGRQIVTLGNSMGGFGALLFAARWPSCIAAIAFVPQYSVHPHVMPDEKRFRVWVNAIQEWRFPTCIAPMPLSCRRLVLFGLEEGPDLIQYRRFSALRAEGLHVIGIAGSTHDLARHLRDKAALRPLFDAIINGGAGGDEVRALLAGLGVVLKEVRPGAPYPDPVTRTQPAQDGA